MFRKLIQSLTAFILTITSNLVGLVGAVLTTCAAALFLGLFFMEQVGFHGGPYLGIIAFLIIPALFVLGLVLIPIGYVRERRRRRLATESGEVVPELPIWALNRDRTRRNFLVFSGLTFVNVLLLAVATYKGVEYMDSTPFCGATCHSVMAPEYTTYQRSPHARVACVECHIGPGANWFVKSKLSGSWQVVSVALNLYPRPIPVPVHNLRPARETCEQCHWPAKFVGDSLRVRTHYAEDEANTELKTVLVLKVGGIRPEGSHGIHWHVDPTHEVRYRSDPTRETIYEVEMVQGGQVVTRWKGSAFDSPEAQAAREWRTMDCVDCHNRPTHIYRSPETELDTALEQRRIDRSLPYIRRQGLEALNGEYPSHEAARDSIRQQILAFYEKDYPDVARDKADAVEAAARELGQIYAWNVFPEMDIKWGTYLNHIGHMSSPGCTRCHDEEHTSEAGETISGDCSTCHTILAQEEENPEVLKTLLD